MKYLYLLEILVFQVTLNFYRDILLGVQVVFTLNQTRTRTAFPFPRICLALSLKCHVLREKGIFLDVARYTRLVICISFCFKTLPHSKHHHQETFGSSVYTKQMKEQPLNVERKLRITDNIHNKKCLVTRQKYLRITLCHLL